MSRRILITGPTSGTGKFLTRDQLDKGNELILLGRNQAVLKELEQTHDRSKIFSYTVDLSNLIQTKSIATQIGRDFDALDVIICNAGILGREQPEISDEGLEETFLVNYLSHYILLSELLPLLRKNNAQIIFMGSRAAMWYPIDFEDPQSMNRYAPMRAYGRSKALLQMLGVWLSKNFEGDRIKAYTIDPGTFRSGISRSRGFWFRSLYKLASWAMRSPQQAVSDLLEILDGADYPSGALVRKGKAINLSYTNEDFGNLLEISTKLSGCDIRMSLSSIK